ncbi:MAG: PilX N-terminal domain-containing pilus assembly protein [Gammaproteobacteria bacterium]|nr:PilX N-terminal domain-containing pilus assembly protein [Gammaproteobacteria bacterium]
MVLFISLVMLLILTILGVSAVQTTILDVRMARNDHDSLLAFQSAESALRDAEDFLDGVTSIVDFTNTGNNGLWTVADLGDPARWDVANVWTGANSVVAATVVAGVAEQPRFIIEHAASVIRADNAYLIEDPYASSATDRIEIFRVTARGVGGSANSRVLLQSAYGRILD